MDVLHGHCELHFCFVTQVVVIPVEDYLEP